jgi:transcriptional regulator with XRE-family HTH domain
VSMMLFKDVLQRDRKRRNLSQAELASFLEVFQQTVSGWETGRVFIDDAQKKLLVQVLGPDSELALNLDQIDFDTFSYVPKASRKGSMHSRSWVGLTVAEAVSIKRRFEDAHFDMIDAVEQLLRKKNT